MPKQEPVTPIRSTDLDGNTYIFGAPVTRDGDSAFVKVFWDKLRDIIVECSPSDNKVMDFLVTKGATGKPVNSTVQDIAKATSLNRKTVQDSLSFFLENDFIRRGNHWVIYLNPRIIFKGKKFYREMAIDVYRVLPYNGKKTITS